MIFKHLRGSKFLMKKILKAFLALVLLLILIPVAVYYFRPDEIISKAEAKKELSSNASHFINWRGAEIHYTDEGNANGFPVMMIHGFGGSYTNFDTLASMMKDEYRVIRIDLPGFGLSDFPQVKDKEDYIEDYRDYLSFMLDTLHLDSLYVIGNSMGGSITWDMAVHHPDKVRKIVLLAAAGYETEKVAKKLAMFRYQSVKGVFDKGMPLFMSRSGMEKGYADDSKINPAVVAMNNKFSNRSGNIRHMLALAACGQFPDSSLITKVQCPTLVIWGRQDEIIPSEHSAKFKRDIPNCRVLIYDPCGHMPMMERPEDTKRDVEAFFKE
jgi:pimeloyl-ACP methyl ester carboxylesterase